METFFGISVRCKGARIANDASDPAFEIVTTSAPQDVVRRPLGRAHLAHHNLRELSHSKRHPMRLKNTWQSDRPMRVPRNHHNKK